MQSTEDAIAPVRESAAAADSARILLRFEGFRSSGHRVDLASPGIQALSDSHFELLECAPEYYYATCTTDLRAFHCYDRTGGTCYGPVARHIHGIDEAVEIESIRHTLKAYALFILNWCDVSVA